MRKKTNLEFLNELQLLNNNIDALEEYKGAHNKILFKCTKCEYEWKTAPHNIL